MPGKANGTRAKVLSPPPQSPPPAMAARIGHYELIGRIGAGGMAEAFRAKARGPGGYERQLILKCMLPDIADDPEFVRLFVAEAKILGMLNHPNIVQVYDFGEHEGRHFLALEFLDGPSVAQIQAMIRKSGAAMPVGIAAYIAREMCLGLSAAHNLRGPKGEPLNVVHRDVTPSNVMTTTAGEVKLVDFGIARLGQASAATRAGTVRGKPAYLSPEQILGGEIDGRADVFTTGIVLHEMLTLEPLFQGENDLATIYKVMEHPIPPPSAIRKDVPPALEAIIMRALERPPANRFQSAMEMAQALTEFLQTCSIGRPEIAALAATYVRLLSKRKATAGVPTIPAVEGARPSQTPTAVSEVTTTAAVSTPRKRRATRKGAKKTGQKSGTRSTSARA